jgi:hypothetical protein
LTVVSLIFIERHKNLYSSFCPEAQMVAPLQTADTKFTPGIHYRKCRFHEGGEKPAEYGEKHTE